MGRERDAVRIKEKQVEDQLETIHRLKQELSAKELELQSYRLEVEREVQTLQLQLEQEETTNSELQVVIIIIYNVMFTIFINLEYMYIELMTVYFGTSQVRHGAFLSTLVSS